MLSEDKYFQTLTEDELWQRYCGFLDLSADEFVAIQKELLIDQIERVADSLLGKRIMNSRKPKTVEEFRQMVPLTTYEDYEPYLSERREDALAIKPHTWCHSAGRGGHFKWIPQSLEFLEKNTKNVLGSLILASTRQRGRINISPGFRFLSILPPPPYASGVLLQYFAEHVSFQAIPPIETAKNMEFQERVRKAFQIALQDGVDVILAIGSVLAKMGEEFGGKARSAKFSRSTLKPNVVFRLLRGLLHSKREKMPLLPKDLWPAKAIIAGGVDTGIYSNDITRYWGSEPYNFYVCAEGFIMATQGWNRKGMVFLPDTVFFEFIPYEQLEHPDDNDYKPSTVLLNELEEGRLYELVITQFYGMPLLRYRMKDIIKVIALKDEESGINLTQIVFQCRVGETINLAGLADLDEKTIWQAIANTGIKYTEWSARKEYDRNQSFLRLYLELKEEKEATEIATMIDEQLRIVDTDYKDIDSYLELQPVRVTLLTPGTFQRYMDEKVKEGADLAHLKPAHMNAPEVVIQRLLQLSEVGIANG
jgi:hypothetical protein